MHPAGIDHQQQHVDPLQRSGHLLHHLPSQRRIGFMQTRRIDENDLPLRFGRNPLDAIASGLRFGSNDCDLLPDQSIHKRGLPRIWPPHDGHKAGSKILPSRAAFLCSHQGFTIGSSSALGCSESCISATCAVLASLPVSAATVPPLL